MTPEQEADLFTALGRIEQKIDSNTATFVEHTAQDDVNFTKIEAQLEDVRNRQMRDVENKITALHLVAAKKEGEDAALAKVASSSGGKMGAFVGALVSVVVSAVAAYFGNK